ANPVAIQLPVGAEDGFTGVIDLVEMNARIWDRTANDLGTTWSDVPIPDELADEAAKWRSALLEAIAETDEELLERYLDNGDLELDELQHGIRNATIANQITPVLCGSAFKNKGVQLLLDAVVAYLPSPRDIPPV